MIYGEEDFPGGSVLKNLLSVKKMQARSLGQEESVEEARDGFWCSVKGPQLGAGMGRRCMEPRGAILQ